MNTFLLSGDYTFLHTVNRTIDTNVQGYSLPGVPDHKLGLKAELHGGPFRLYYEMAYTGEVWWSPQNFADGYFPPRALHALGASAGPFEHIPFTFTFEIRNLADLRVVDLPMTGVASTNGRTSAAPLSDFLGYPLPGRAFYATVSFQR